MDFIFHEIVTRNAERPVTSLAGSELRDEKNRILKSENIYIREKRTRCPTGNYIDRHIPEYDANGGKRTTMKESVSTEEE